MLAVSFYAFRNRMFASALHNLTIRTKALKKITIDQPYKGNYGFFFFFFKVKQKVSSRLSHSACFVSGFSDRPPQGQRCDLGGAVPHSRDHVPRLSLPPRGHSQQQGRRAQTHHRAQVGAKKNKNEKSPNG